jgi:hypothetical protein
VLQAKLLQLVPNAVMLDAKDAMGPNEEILFDALPDHHYVLWLVVDKSDPNLVNSRHSIHICGTYFFGSIQHS